MPTKVTAKNRFLKFHSSLDDKLILTHFHGQEQLSTVYDYRLEFLSEDSNIALHEIVGKPVSVELELPDSKKRFFHGIIAEFRFLGTRDNYFRYQATMKPWLWFLSRTADCRVFQNKSVPDIIFEVFKDLNGMTDYEPSLGSYEKWKYCVQYRETDLNFVMRLMEQAGIYFYFKHEQSKHILVLADSLGAHSPYPNFEKIKYYPPETSGNMRDEEHISDWSVGQSVVPRKVAFNDYNFETPNTDLEVKKIDSFPHPAVITDDEIYDYPGEYLKTTPGNTVAKHRLESMVARQERVLGSCNARGMAVGYLFTPVDFPRKDQNVKHLVVSATYQIQCDDVKTTSSTGDDIFYNCQFEALKSSVPFRSEPITPKPIVQGPQTALVVGPKGEEIYTDKYGRIKVQFHWDRQGKKDENSSCWIRVSNSWAGKSWGSVHIPRIGHEVVVSFLEGDPDRPLVTGSVYHAENPHPYKLPDNKTKSGILTHSTKQGNDKTYNEIRFEDEKDKEELRMQAEKDMNVAVKETRKSFIGGEIERDQNKGKKSGKCPKISDVNESLEVFASRETIIHGKDTLTISKNSGGDGREMTVENGDHVTTVKKGDHTTKIKLGKTYHEAMKSIELKVGQSSIKLEPAKITIKSVQILIKADAKLDMQSPMTTLKGDAMCTIQGGMVKIN